MLNNNQENSKSYAYEAKMDLGLDTTSITNFISSNHSPFMLNLISKEGNGLKRRDGLALIEVHQIISGEKICGSYSTEDGTVFIIVKNYGLNKYFIIAMKGSRTNISGKIELPPDIFTSPTIIKSEYIRFKVRVKYPDITNNIFVYGYFGNKYDYSKHNYFNIAGTITYDLTFGAFSLNTVLKSTKVSGVLKIVDLDVINNRMICLVFDDTSKNYKILFGSKNSIDLDDFYNLPNVAIGTGVVIQKENVFILTPVSVYLLSFKNDFTAHESFSKYINNFGCKHPWAYSVINTDCYMVSFSSFFKFSLIVDSKNQTLIDVNESIDESVSNLYPLYNTYLTLYRWDEKTIYFYGSFKNEFTEYSIYLWKSIIKFSNITFEDFRVYLDEKIKFAVCYNIINKSWFLLYWDLEIKGAVKFLHYSGTVEKPIISEFSYMSDYKVLLNNKNLTKDIDEDFPVMLMPSIINKKCLTGFQILIERIVVLFSNINKNINIDEKNALVSSVIFNENITRLGKDSIFNTLASTLYLTNDISLKVCSNLVDVSPNHLICLNSNCIDVLKGVVVNVKESGNITL